ncbi:cysteine hydrolase family protein [Aeromicrobium sp. 50.2.37]|uniref:cysteine hydrolase family protein n=1 Tax=Aeromicrobium sp. 50.2.37 TaxID=2969305 RepID=UPI00214FB7C0|nr:isochorismatase family cysteine hydrolase [Aeromicrobium sp. 50.2.37]MCR4512672.1 cysteine hydrolase [Aeromicrobium sp. 50.2.37]
MDLNASTTAFIACHFENDVVGADGAFAPFFRAQVEERGVLAVARRLVDGAHDKGVQVAFTRVAFKEGHSDLVTNIPLLGVVAQQGSLLDGSPGADIVDELKPTAEDWVITNPKVSAFASSDLDERLKNAGIDTVVLFGVASNVTIESSGRSAGDLGYRVVVVEDACSAASPEAHQATIESFGLLGEVASADDVLAAL